MGSWMEPNLHKGHGGRISKELAEQLGVFDTATGLRRKPDGSLEVLWNADTPKDVTKNKVQRHIQVDEVDGQIRLTHQNGETLTFADTEAARNYLHACLGENCTFRQNGSGWLASRA